MDWAPPLTLAQLIVTPGATDRLRNVPTGALSKFMIETVPSKTAAVSKAFAAAVENGPDGLPGSTFKSAPVKITSALPVNAKANVG